MNMKRYLYITQLIHIELYLLPKITEKKISDNFIPMKLSLYRENIERYYKIMFKIEFAIALII